MNTKLEYDLIVVGGGASGLIASGRAAERGLRVLLLEKNKRLGEKLRATGGGRCNICNAEYDERKLLKAYGASEKYLYSLFSQFGVKNTFSFFESLGLPLMIEGEKRAFPKTEKADDVVRVLESYMKKGKVKVLINSVVTKVESEGGLVKTVHCGKNIYSAKNYIFATGSISHKEMGATDDGFRWLKSLGHKITDSTPNVVPIAVKDRWIKDLAGVTSPKMKITFFTNGKKSFVLKGKILFTHFGLSGPIILNSAYKIADFLKSGPVTAKIDLFPDLDLGALEQIIIKIFVVVKNGLN